MVCIVRISGFFSLLWTFLDLDNSDDIYVNHSSVKKLKYISAMNQGLARHDRDLTRMAVMAILQVPAKL